MDKNMDQPPPYDAPGVHQPMQQPTQPVTVVHQAPTSNTVYVTPQYPNTSNAVLITPHPQQPTVNTVLVTPNVVSLRLCPNCRVGILRDEFTVLGILCAIFFFPIGFICCFLMTRKRCNHCRLTFI